MPLAAGVLIVLLVVLTVSGHAPEFRALVPFSPHGLVAVAPADITRIEVRAGPESVALRRGHGGWVADDASDPVPAELASHLEAGLRFMHVTAPVRELGQGELTNSSFAEFGLDPPDRVVLLATPEGAVVTANFGAPTPAATSQYVRLAGAPTVYLMPRHVGAEWQVAADMARRLRAGGEAAAATRGRSAGLLLPVSMAQVWAVEIVQGGKLARFERDGAGNWFLHVGQHTHAGNANAHVADPAQARVIGTALEAFDASAIETRVARGAQATQLGRFGLALPPLIVLFYARDNSTPLVRLEIGAVADGVGRYARLAPDGDVVTVAEFEIGRLGALLKAVRAGS